MKVARNITKTPSGTFRVRIRREYLDHPIQAHAIDLKEAYAVRDDLERKHPIRSPHYHPKKPRCPHCGQAFKH